jgi:outer membrane receptor protein involved in Fe transport
MDRRTSDMNTWPVWALLLCTLLARPAMAQQTDGAQFIIQGSITDDQHDPIPFANAALYAASDSSLVTGAASDATGKFEIPVPPGHYYLNVTILSYGGKTIPDIVITNHNLDLGKILLTPDVKLLQEVVVKGERGQMELHLDKRVFNVAQDMSNIGNTAADVLNNIPSVSVDVEGNVSLRGSQNVRILIDGKPSGLVGISSTDALRQLQGDLVERVEVITNPSSRYDAEGEVGIINIVLKKNTAKGLNGSFTTTAGYPSNYGGSFNLNYRKRKVNWFSSYGINYRKSPGRGSSNQQYTSPDTSFTYEQSNRRTRSGTSHTLSGGADYALTDKSTLTGSVLYRRSQGSNESRIEYRDFDEQGTLTQTVIREQDEKEPERNIEASLSYRKDFEKDRSLTVDAKWIQSHELEESAYRQGDVDGNNVQLQRASNTENETNGLLQLDYVHPVGKKGKVEAGLKSTRRVIDNDYSLEQWNASSEWTVIPAFNNNLIYTENIHAGYAMASKESDKFSYQAGLRGEFSDITTELTETDGHNNRRYFNLFPSVHVSYALREQKTLQLSYSYRISRPRFRDLIPFSNFTDARVFSTGNPGLNPEYTHAVEAGYLLHWEEGSLLSSAYYRHRLGVIQNIRQVIDSSGITFIVPVNLATENAYGFEFNFSYTLHNWWRLNTSANFYRAITDGTYQEQQLHSDTYTLTGRLTSRMTFFKKIDFQTSVNYRAPRVTTQGKDLAMYTVDLGLSKDIFKGKGTLTASVRDLLNSQKRRNITEYEGYYSRSDFQWRMRQFIVSFTFRINRTKEKQREEQGPGKEQDDDF